MKCQETLNEVFRQVFANPKLDITPELTPNDIDGWDSMAHVNLIAAVELRFKSMDDFHPERVADQVAPLRKLVETRQRLSDLLSKMDGNDRLDELLQEVMSSTEKVEQLAKEAGVEKSAPAEGEEPKKED